MFKSNFIFRQWHRYTISALFFITIFFNITALKHIWGIEIISRICNVVTLFVMFIYVFLLLDNKRYNNNIWLYYMLPGFLVAIGYFVNITVNSIRNVNLINYYAILLPWLVYLAMPGMIIQDNDFIEVLWKYYYYFMLIAVIVGLVEYYTVFSDLSALKLIYTPNGQFWSGYVSLFYGLEDGSIHYRFYGCFFEPGTLAMYLLPAISYAYFYDKYFGMVLFPVCIYFTDSLGGIISGTILTLIIIYIYLNKKGVKRYIPVGMVIFIFIIIFPYMSNYFAMKYDDKNNSRIVREDNFINTIFNLPAMIMNNPLGLDLTENTPSDIENEYYFGSNFTPGNALQMGGISSFLGYCVVLIVSFVASLMSVIKRNLSRQQKTVFTSLIVLLPFIFQRTVVWDSAIYSILFAPTILNYLGDNMQ